MTTGNRSASYVALKQHSHNGMPEGFVMGMRGIVMWANGRQYTIYGTNPDRVEAEWLYGDRLCITDEPTNVRPATPEEASAWVASIRSRLQRRQEALRARTEAECADLDRTIRQYERRLAEALKDIS